MMKDKYLENCWSDLAWNEEHTKMYTDCTKDIADSSPQIKAAICDIQKVAKGDYAAFDFWLILQSMTNDERLHESKELDMMTGKFTKFNFYGPTA